MTGCISFVSYIKPQLSFWFRTTIFRCISFVSYIKPQLCSQYKEGRFSCISFVSYIKPQLISVSFSSVMGCISFVSYIKPQLVFLSSSSLLVVYLSFPTSNHNAGDGNIDFDALYIFRFLHQTTTFCHIVMVLTGCISFVSYIKPQRSCRAQLLVCVVYLSFPTSNHNVSVQF